MNERVPILPARGDLFEGKYRIEEQIGQGGYASVFRATEPETRRQVAVKILTPSTDARPYDERVRGRFSREARLISELHDPHTITLHDYGKSGDGLLYMVFEYVDGTPLDRMIRREAPLPPTRVARILLQILASLTEAHLVGVLHRDIKPSNVMVYDYLGDTDRVKVLDFGIAKPVTGEREVSTELTREGIIIGTPRYMSPEQVIGTELRPASDIFSVGLVAIEMLSGEKGLKGDNDQEILRGLLGPEPVNIPETVLIPAPLRRVIGRMVAKDLGERFSSTIEVIEAIHAWLSGRAVDDWIDPERSKTIERIHTREISARGRAPTKVRGMQIATTVSVFLLGVLSTAAIFRVTELEQRLSEITRVESSSSESESDLDSVMDEIGERVWLVDLNRPEVKIRFTGADGMVETDRHDKVPVRSTELVEVVVEGASAPAGLVFVTTLEGSGPSKVRLATQSRYEAAQGALPESWELVSQMRGRALSVADALATAERADEENRTREARQRWDVPLFKTD